MTSVYKMAGRYYGTQLRNLALKIFDEVLQLPMRDHLVIGFSIRLLLVVYAGYHDAFSLVRYTDVDYKVFTDAARHVMMGKSPYERHTYRYSPIIAWLLLPNIFLHESFGKILFSLVDILITICIKSFVQRKLHLKPNAATVGKYSSFFWLYNPYSIVISTRGNADSITCLLILLSLYFLQIKHLPLRGNTQFFLSGIFLGISIHLRLYPIVFSFPMYLSLGEYVINRNTSYKTALRALLIPNSKQLTFAITTVVYFATCTYGMYLIYGYQFIFETYIYHLFRSDTRHNFSLFFYYSYLRMGDMSFDIMMFTIRIIVIILLLLVSLGFGTLPLTLPFALFLQATVLVTYNSVVTSQYFLWYLSLLPLIIQDIKATPWEYVIYPSIWIFSQCVWLFLAYLLEFLNESTYRVLWMSCIVFFGVNHFVVFQMINAYYPGHGFGIAHLENNAKNK